MTKLGKKGSLVIQDSHFVNRNVYNQIHGVKILLPIKKVV